MCDVIVVSLGEMMDAMVGFFIHRLLDEFVWVDVLWKSTVKRGSDKQIEDRLWRAPWLKMVGVGEREGRRLLRFISIEIEIDVVEFARRHTDLDSNII